MSEDELMETMIESEQVVPKSKKSKRESRGVHSRLLSFAVVVETSTLIHHPCNHVRLNTPGVKENAGEKHQELCFTLRLLR